MFPECLLYRDGAETEQHFLHRTINGLQISSERQSNRCQQVGMEIVTDPRAARQYVLWCLHAEGMIERWLTKVGQKLHMYCGFIKLILLP